MQVSKILFASLMVGLIASNSYAAAVKTDQTISYKNQRGSTLSLNFDQAKNNTGSLSGTFITAVGNCQADMNKPMPVTGYFNNNVIALSINFPDCKQVVSMTGYLMPDKSHLKTLWLSTAVVANPNTTDWDSNAVGTDWYTRIGQK